MKQQIDFGNKRSEELIREKQNLAQKYEERMVQVKE